LPLIPQVVQTLKSLGLGGLVGGVPALHDTVEEVGPLVRRVAAQPRRLDHAAALWCGGLLVLAGKIVIADRPADLLEHFGRLALGMQSPAARPRDAAALHQRLDHIGLVLLGDRRVAEDLPRLLRPARGRTRTPPDASATAGSGKAAETSRSS
jgi:hypothetical protein